MEEHSIYDTATGHFTGARIALWPFDADELARWSWAPGSVAQPEKKQ